MSPRPPALLRALRVTVDAAEPPVARTIGRAMNTPAVAASLLEVGRWVRWGAGRANVARGRAVHLFSIPNVQDVESIANDLAHIRHALAELEARVEELR